MKKSDFKEKYASFALVFFPILECYNVGSVALYKYLMLISCLLLAKGTLGKKNILPKVLLFFYIYAFTIPQFNAIATNAMSHFTGSYLTPLLFALNLGVFIPFLNYKYVKKYYTFFIIVACGVFLAQELSFLFFGKRFSALIPFMQLYTGVSAADLAPHIAVLNRSCSIFAEPSHFAQYLTPYVAIVMHDLHQKKKFFNVPVVVLSLVFILLRSGNGLILIALLWVFFVLFSNTKTIWKYTIVIPLSIIIGIYGYMLFSNTEQGAAVLDRAEELDVDFSRVSSGTIRVYRGFWVYNDMEIGDKILGVGAGGIYDAVDKSRFHWMFYENERYLNNASAFLVAYGLIGTILFIVFLVSLCDKRKFGTILLVVAFVGLSFMESFFWNTRMLLYIGLAFCLKNIKDPIEYEEDIVNSPEVIPGNRC